MEPFQFGEYTVGPSITKKAEMRSFPIPHVFLIKERPAAVSIKSLVKDAVARLPGGVGTRSDVALLVKMS